MRGVALALGLSVAAWIAGCGGQGTDALPICDRFCECRYDLPAFRDSCIDTCVNDLPPVVDLPPGCLDCFEQASCVTLDSCQSVCGGDTAEEGI